MAFASGVFNRIYSWTADKANGIKIRADRMDNEMNGMATGLSTCVLKDGTQTITADLPMNGHKLTGISDAAARNQNPSVGQIQDQSVTWCGTAAGTANALTFTPTPPITAYAIGQSFVFKAAASPNSAATTLAISGLATIAVQYNGAACIGGEILASKWYRITLDTLTTCQIEAISTQLPFIDTIPMIRGSADNTKQARFEVDGFTTGTTRVMTIQDADGTLAYISQLGGDNILINPTFYINQAAPATSADDTYAHDQWYALTQTNTIALSTLTDVENTTPRMARLTQSQAVAQRMGYAQIIEGKNCKHLRGQAVNLKLRYRCSASQAIRFAILEWTGTEDAVTSDVVLDWTSGTYTANNFFLASNLTITNVAAATPSAATLADYTVTATLGSSFNNLIVFVWTEATAAQNVTLDLGKVKLEPGSVGTPFYPRSIEVETALCQRYLPAYNAPSGSAVVVTPAGQCFSTTGAVIPYVYPVTPRVVPTGITVSNVSHFSVSTAAFGSATATVMAINDASLNAFDISVTVASGLVAGNATILRSSNASGQILLTGAQL